MNKLRTPEDHTRFQRALIAPDEAFRVSEAKWGVGRLERLVGHITYAAYQRGWAAYRAALDDGDCEALEAVAPKMAAALAFMDREASAAGHAPLAPEAWEAPLADGSVLVVVRTTAEATAVLRAAQGRGEGNLPPDLTLAIRATHEGRALAVWTMAELARVLPTLAITHEVKKGFPGAEVVTGTVWEGTAAWTGTRGPEMHAHDQARGGYPLPVPLETGR